MQLFIDSADIAVIRELADTGLVDGVTTNPSLVAGSGRTFKELIAEVCQVVQGSVSAEVAALDAATMIAEGEALAAIAPNVTVKLPLTWDGLKATQHFAAQGVMTNVTLCFSVTQALMAAKAGATFVSPFVGRLDDQGAHGVGLIEEIRTLYDQFDFDTEILAASVRNVSHIKAVALAGADCATLPPAVFRDLVKHPLTQTGLDQFTKDWARTGQSIL